VEKIGRIVPEIEGAQIRAETSEDVGGATLSIDIGP